MASRWLWASFLALASFAAAQFPPTPEGVTTKQVSGHPGVSISYKETHICDTKVKAWAGYVHMPPSYLEDVEGVVPYNISTFFWYFEARNDPQNAPTGIYLAGGPGQSSLYGTASDGGPCYVAPDSNSTYENPWSMNNYANILYIDQPAGTGFSYSSLVKSTLNQVSGEIKPFDGKPPATDATLLYGMLPSQKETYTANTTGVAAATLLDFSQIWFSEFPEWTTCNKQVSIWGNSYGGYFVTAFGAAIQKNNAAIKSGASKGTIIDLSQIGFTNGCVDQLYQAEWYPEMAYANVYDLPLINKTTYEKLLALYKEPKVGCLALMQTCRELGELYDPQEFAVNATVNKICNKAQTACLPLVIGPTLPEAAGGFELPPYRSPDDMSHFLPDGIPTQYLLGYFNQQWVQRELGVPANFTGNSNTDEGIFLLAGADSIRRAGMKDVEYLLSNGVKVTLIYGDRDQRCPWLGAEKLSLAANWTGADDFRSAGYANMVTNSSYNGGVVRQHGNLSFTRVFQAGHDAYPYQPETIFQIFNRSMFDTDVATGKHSTAGSANDYSTTGPASSEGIKLKLPPSPPVDCYLWSLNGTCTVDQLEAVLKGTAEIVDWRVVKPANGGGPI